MLAVILVFGLPVLVAGAMIDPEPISLRALITYWGIMGAITPFAAWPLFLIQIASPPAGRSRLAAVVNVWFGGTTIGVSVIYWLYALLSYNRRGSS